MGFKFKAPKIKVPTVKAAAKTFANINPIASGAGAIGGAIEGVASGGGISGVLKGAAAGMKDGIGTVDRLLGGGATADMPEVPGDVPLEASLKAPDAAATTVAAVGQQVEDNKRRRAFRTLFTGGLGLSEETKTTSASNSLLGF